MGTEAFVELLWRIHTKPGIVTVSAGKEWYEPELEQEDTTIAQPVSVFFNTTFPAATKLTASTFGETLW